MRLLLRSNVLTMLLIAIVASPGALADIDSMCRARDASAFPPTLWVLCADGRVTVSDDAGATWSERLASSSKKLRGIEALDAHRAFVSGDDGTLLATEDGGRTWKQVETPVEDHLTSVHFIGEEGWVAGWGGILLYSKDGGKTWTRQVTDTSNALESVYFADRSHGWAVGWVGTIIRTVDGGETWREVRTPAAQWSLSAVYFQNANDGWAVGFLGQILRSRDGGLSWEAQPSPSKTWLKSVVFDSAGRGWIAGTDGVLTSDDGGESWRYAVREEHLFARDLLRFDGSLLAVAAGEILQLTESGEKLDEPRRLPLRGGETEGAFSVRQTARGAVTASTISRECAVNESAAIGAWHHLASAG